MEELQIWRSRFLNNPPFLSLDQRSSYTAIGSGGLRQIVSLVASSPFCFLSSVIAILFLEQRRLIDTPLLAALATTLNGSLSIASTLVAPLGSMDLNAQMDLEAQTPFGDRPSSPYGSAATLSDGSAEIHRRSPLISRNAPVPRILVDDRIKSAEIKHNQPPTCI